MYVWCQQTEIMLGCEVQWCNDMKCRRSLISTDFLNISIYLYFLWFSVFAYAKIRCLSVILVSVYTFTHAYRHKVINVHLHSHRSSHTGVFINVALIIHPLRFVWECISHIWLTSPSFFCACVTFLWIIRYRQVHMYAVIKQTCMQFGDLMWLSVVDKQLCVRKADARCWNCFVGDAQWQADQTVVALVCFKCEFLQLCDCKGEL